jgi:hypothetical protein
MSISTATVDIDENALFTVRPTFMNSGQSPARDLRWGHQIAFRSIRGPKLTWQSENEEINRELAPHTFAAGEKYALLGVTPDLILDRDSADALWECKEIELEVRFDVEWRDVFGLPFTETFHYEATMPVAIGAPTRLRPWRGLAPT